MESKEIIKNITLAREKLYAAYNAGANMEDILRLSQELDVLIVEAYKKIADLGFMNESFTQQEKDN